MNTSYITVGQLGRPHGVKGWIKVNSFTDPIDNLLDYQPYYYQSDKKWLILPVTHLQSHGAILIGHVEGYDTPEAARTLTGIEIAIARTQLPKPAKGEYLWCDLIGLNVITLQGQPLGQVTSLFRTGGHDILCVQGAKEYLIPFVRNHFVMDISLAKKQITVDWVGE